MSTEAKPHYLEMLHRDLALALGDAVWAFAQIEWVTYEYIGKLATDELDQLIGDIQFRGRTSILRRLVERNDASEPLKQRARRAIGDAEALAGERNIIVHNPWLIWVDLDAQDFMTEIQKYSDRGKKVDLGEIHKFVESANRVERELKEALDAL